MIQDGQTGWFLKEPSTEGIERQLRTILEENRLKEISAAAQAYALRAFSYEEVLAEHRENDPGVKYSDFHNTSRVALETIGDVLERAKGECTIHYDTADVSHDDGASVWQIVFYTKEAAGGDQAVYMDSYGVTCLLVYGE